ncbi:MAG TPA: Crp/Fnr family transcriptional regulator [Candidatus Sulfotelmatobacter sp.]|nr:Crp/Fnr family transcriptional regulator [Candidatus Sulfotelmatobacter sp.]
MNALSPSTRSLLESRMTAHGGGIGDVLQAAGQNIDAIWFPLSGIVSTLRPLENDTSVEVDAAGSEGFVGIELTLGDRRSCDTWLVQSPGRFARLDAQVFLEVFERDATLRDVARRYVSAVLCVRGQWVACNARHTIEQRLAKWLLATRDRVGEEIQITQDVVAMMLGVRRASVVTVLGRMVADGLVAHGYARMRILDDVRLESVACPCYGRAAGLLRNAFVANGAA